MAAEEAKSLDHEREQAFDEASALVVGGPAAKQAASAPSIDPARELDTDFGDADAWGAAGVAQQAASADSASSQDKTAAWVADHGQAMPPRH